jgi:hypothetical protein
VAIETSPAVIGPAGCERHPFPDIWALARVFDARGFERCLWDTDWTRAFAAVTYEQAAESFIETGRLSQSEPAMLGVAQWSSFIGVAWVS